ncbi:MAG: hypothetical protein IKI50_04915, partial [Clostridia bacterium]|nr:hypothetical protein [Clostridia bacterium]
LGCCEQRDYTPEWKENLFCSCHASQWSYREDNADLHKRIDRVITCTEAERQTVQRELTRLMPFDLRKTAVFFNPFDRPIRKAVRLIITSPDPDKLELCDGNGKTLLHQAVMPYRNGKIWEWDYLVLLDLPACGYNSITIRNGDFQAVEKMEGDLPKAPRRRRTEGRAFSIENEYLRLQFEQGDLVSILCKDTGEELKGKTAFNMARFHKFGNIDAGVVIKNIEEIIDAHWDYYAVTETGPVRFAVTLYGKCGPHPVQQTISLTAGCRQVDFSTDADWKKCEGFMTLDVPCEQVETLYGGIPFGTEDRRVDLEHYAVIRGKQIFDPVGALHRAIAGLFYAKDFAGYTMQHTSLALAAVTGDRYFMWDKEYNTLGHIVQYTVGDMYDWMIPMNDIAFRSFGKHTFTHTLLVGRGEQPRYEMQAQAEAQRARIEYVRPACGTEQQQKTLPESASLLAAEDPRVRVSAFYGSNGKTLLRVWEAAGDTVKTAVQLPAAFQTVRRVDVTGRAQKGPAPRVKGRELTLTLRPHEVLTVELA